MRELDSFAAVLTAVGALFGVFGTVIAGWLKGKQGLEATIDARLQALLDRQDDELKAKIAELKERRAEVARLEHEGRSCEQRCSELEARQAFLQMEIDALRDRQARLEETSEPGGFK